MVLLLAVLALIGAYYLNLKVIILLCVLGVGYYFYLKHRCSYFASRNIPQPPVTSYFLGNLHDLEKDGKHMEQLRAWDSEYGKLFGIMEGSHRVLVTSDVNILHEVFVKQFPIFQSRKVHAAFVIDQQNDPRLNLFLAEGKKWKRLRGLITSSLTVKQIKQIDPIVKQVTNELLEHVRENRDDHKMNIQPTLLDASFAVIARSVLGIHEKLGQSKYIEEVIEALSMKETSKSYIKSFFAGTYEFRIVTRFLQILTLLTSIGAILRLRNKCEEMIIKREKETVEDKEKRQQDFIDFLRESQEEIDTSGDSSLTLREPKKLTREEVIGTALLFLIAGGDTTSNLTGYCLYELAQHPEYQYMILQEIKDCIESDDDINYNSIKELSFLDRFMKEVSRMHPVGFPVLARRAVETTSLPHPNGGTFEIEKGVCVFANAPVIHMDKEIWGEDADKFDPDRFLPENSKDRHPMALLTFGAGPRICPGKNLAVYEVKHFIVYLLREFKIELHDDTKLNEITRTLLCPESMNLSFIPWNL